MGRSNSPLEQDFHGCLGLTLKRTPKTSDSGTQTEATHFMVANSVMIVTKNCFGIREDEIMKAFLDKNVHYKTKMCRNLPNCPFGKKCHFAHSRDEESFFKTLWNNRL